MFTCKIDVLRYFVRDDEKKANDCVECVDDLPIFDGRHDVVSSI